VTLEKEKVIEDLDIFARVGKDRALPYTFENVFVKDGVLDIEFTKKVEFPIIAAIALENEESSQKINCGGDAYAGYNADLGAGAPHPPADDFYTDWALHEFGLEMAGEAARIFSEMDGRLPRPSDWVGGPGGYRPDPRPWKEVRHEYVFVDKLAELRPGVTGAGNLARFDYWLDNFRFLRATGHMRCAWAAYDRAIKKVHREKRPQEKTRLAREVALPRRIALIEVVEEAYAHLLATVNTSGAMGTLCNLEQHTFPTMLDEPAEELEKILGEPLPPEAQLTHEYRGPTRVFVPTVRSSLLEGEPLTLKVIVLDEKILAPSSLSALHWRRLGTGSFSKVPLQHLARGVYTVEIPGSQIAGADIEYYVEVQLADGESVHWPATAGTINQTVVIMPEV